MGFTKQSIKPMLGLPVQTDLSPYLSTKKHEIGSQWHTLGPPNHLAVDKLERNWVPPAQKALTEEFTPFMEEYFWRVDNGTQGELWRAMFTPTAMYYNNCMKQVIHGYAEADQFEASSASHRWLKHQMDKMSILPSYDNEGPVLVHVLGSHWNGLKTTKDKEEQKKLEINLNCMKFSETFEILKFEGTWKINRVILHMHDDILGMFHAQGVDILPGIYD